MKQDLSGLDRLKTISGTAAKGFGGVAVEFQFGRDKDQTISDMRNRMTTAQARFPDGADSHSVDGLTVRAFPILVVALSGDVPERALLLAARDLQTRIAALKPMLKAECAGHRHEMLEAHDITAAKLITVVTRSTQLITAREVQTATGAVAVKIPSRFTLGELAQINLTYEDAKGTARFNGQPAVAIPVVRRKGFTLIDTMALVRKTVATEVAAWPEGLRRSVTVTTSLGPSANVQGMVSQLEGAMLTAAALVMSAAPDTRSALLVRCLIPTRLLLTVAFLAVLGRSVSNIVMFGLILAVGMRVDGGIVVVEHANTRMAQGEPPMTAHTQAANQMFWPLVSSTATTLCAVLPMLFWRGGQARSSGCCRSG